MGAAMLASTGSFQLRRSRTCYVTMGQSLRLPGPQFPPENKGVGPEGSSILFSPVSVWFSNAGGRGTKGSGTQNLELPTPTITYLPVTANPPSGCVKTNRGGVGMGEGALMCREEAWGDSEEKIAGGEGAEDIVRKSTRGCGPPRWGRVSMRG